MSAGKARAIEKISLFFYFCFIDEARARAAAEKAIQAIKEYRNKKISDARVVRVTSKILQQQKNLGSVSHIGFVEGNIHFPEGADWGPWFEFRKQSEIDKFSTVIWTKILGFSTRDVANGLSVTEGTVKHRLSHALKELGQIIRGEASV